MSLSHDEPAMDFEALPVGREQASEVGAKPTLAITKSRSRLTMQTEDPFW